MAHTRPSDLVEEQIALRRVATLVARAASPEEVFAAVAAEVRGLLAVDLTVMCRYDPDNMLAYVGWSADGEESAVGVRVPLGGQNVAQLVLETGRPARIDDYATATGTAADEVRRRGVRAAVGVPVSVEGRLWGVMTVASMQREPLRPGIEARLAAFTELVATALANAQAHLELRRFAEEQAALRRVATLVARAAPPDEVFAAVAEEVGRLLQADFTNMLRYDTDRAAVSVGAWRGPNAMPTVAVGTRLPLGGRNVTTLVYEAGRPIRIDDYRDANGVIGQNVRERGARSAVGVPISLGGRRWGVMIMATSRESLPANAEARLVGFTELVATAVANAEAQAALAGSRARILAAADTSRRRIERDLHDGAQQRLVALALHVRTTVRAAVPPGADELAAQLDSVAAELGEVLDDLREIARGLHPVVLTDGGLHPALNALARRSAVPVRLDVHVDGRLPEPVELATYYTIAEALTNVAKHAEASVVDVAVTTTEDFLRLRVSDDGRGGADSARGSGIVGLADRVQALGGRLSMVSPPGAGTTVQVCLPLADVRCPGSPAGVSG